MRGGAQSQLMRCSDSNLYVVKFRNNPQHPRVLANELVATRLAEKVGLPVPKAEVVEVSAWLIEHSPEMTIQVAGRSERCADGLQFGSRYILPPFDGQVLDWLPQSHLERVRNLSDFAGMLAFDKWTANANGRQAVFWKRARERKYTVSFIDHGYCFNAGEWTFPDSPLRGVYPWNEVYEGVRDWGSFEPCLTRIEQLEDSAIWECGNDVPPEWYGGDWDALERLLNGLIRRKSQVRELIEEFRTSSRDPFPEWRAEASAD